MLSAWSCATNHVLTRATAGVRVLYGQQCVQVMLRDPRGTDGALDAGAGNRHRCPPAFQVLR